MTMPASIARPLLQQLIAQVRIARAAPLHFHADSASIAASAWRGFWPCLGENERRRIADGESLCKALDAVLEPVLSDVLSDAPCDAPSGHVAREVRGDLCGGACDSSTRNGDHLPSLVRWFERLHAALRTASDLAVAAIVLRLEGYDERDVAVRLGLGMRLVRRMLTRVRDELRAAELPR